MQQRHQLGPYWLYARQSRKTSGRGPRKGIWYITWYESNRATGKRRTCRHSTSIEVTGVEPPPAAVEALTDFYLERTRPQRREPDEIFIADIMAAYYEQRGKHRAAAVQIKTSLRHFLMFLDRQRRKGYIRGAAHLTDMTPKLIEEFQSWRSQPHEYEYEAKGKPVAFQSKGVGWDTIDLNIDYVRASLGWAKERHMIASVPHIAGVEPGLKAGPRETILTIEQTAAVLEEAYKGYENWRSPAAWYFVMIALTTAGRPEAICDLHGAWAIDRDRWLLRFNQPGRPQTKKIRPTIPISKTLMPWVDPLENWFISRGQGGRKERIYGDMRVLSVKKQMARIYDNTGIEGASSVTLRYTISAMLRERDVPEWEADGFTGHASLSTTGRHYARYRPDYYSRAREAVDGYFEDMAALTTVHLRFPCDSRTPKPKVVPFRK